MPHLSAGHLPALVLLPLPRECARRPPRSPPSSGRSERLPAEPWWTGPATAFPARRQPSATRWTPNKRTRPSCLLVSWFLPEFNATYRSFTQGAVQCKGAWLKSDQPYLFISHPSTRPGLRVRSGRFDAPLATLPAVRKSSPSL